MRLGADVRVLWPVTAQMPARFGDLFSNDCAVDSIPAGAAVYASWRFPVLPEDERYLPEGFATVIGGAHPAIRALGKAWWSLRGRPTDRYQYMLFPKSRSRSTRRDGRQIDLEYGRIPPQLRAVYAPLFARIVVRPEILARVDAWASANVDERVVGVQVRTWRDDARRYRKYHVPAMRRLTRLLERTDSRARLLIVSDSDEAIRRLTLRFGADRVLHFPRRTARDESWRAPEGVAEDLIDMLLLARTQRLFASYLSTFSEAAWWLGGARAQVAVF
jgi:hypothetical protein